MIKVFFSIIGIVFIGYVLGYVFFNVFDEPIKEQIKAVKVQYIQRDTFDTIFYANANVKAWTDPKTRCEYLILYDTHLGKAIAITPRMRSGRLEHICH